MIKPVLGIQKASIKEVTLGTLIGLGFNRECHPKERKRTPPQ